MRVGGLRILAAVDVRPHHSARIIDVIAIQARAMVHILSNHLESADRRAVPFASAGDARCGGAMFSPVKINLLFAEIDHDGRAPGMSLRHMRGDQVGDGVISAATAEGRGEQRERGKDPDPICDSFIVRRNLHQWRASLCYSSCSRSWLAVRRNRFSNTMKTIPCRAR